MNIQYEKKLTEYDLNTVNGGVISQEGLDWFERNKNTLIDRANENNNKECNAGLQLIFGIAILAQESVEKVYGVDDLKEVCGQYGVDASDLA